MTSEYFGSIDIPFLVIEGDGFAMIIQERVEYVGLVGVNVWGQFPEGHKGYDPEWERVTQGIGEIPNPLWQHVDNPNAWSLDGGSTYYLINEPLTPSGAPTIYQTSMRPVPQDPYPKTLEEAVLVSLGAASVAWGDDGAFDSEFATSVGNDLVDWINENYEIKEN